MMCLKRLELGFLSGVFDVVNFASLYRARKEILVVGIGTIKHAIYVRAKLSK